jgi:aquaporin Z
MVLVIIGCGVGMVNTGNFIGTLGVACAFGLGLITMAYSIGNISGCHINPAVSLGMVVAHKMSFKDFLVYIAAQFVGGILGALVLEGIYAIAIKNGSAAVSSYLGSNMASSLLGDNYWQGAMLSLIVECVLTFIFVLTILGVTSKVENSSIAGLIIGLALIAVHLLGIQLTGTSVNPARSFGPALIAMMNGHFEPIQQVWVFFVGPFAGAALAALLFNFFEGKKASAQPEAK